MQDGKHYHRIGLSAEHNLIRKGIVKQDGPAGEIGPMMPKRLVEH